MTVLTRLIALAGLALMAGCMTVPQSEPCPNPQACQLSQLMAQGMATDVGRDFGGGVILANVQAAGSLVVVDLQVPIPGAGLEEVQKRAVHQLTAESFVTGFCEPDDAGEMFQFGNAFQVRTFGNDNTLFGATTLRAC